MDSEGVFVFWTGYSISAEIICAGSGTSILCVGKDVVFAVMNRDYRA